MRCYKCNSQIDSKKFQHPILKDEYICVNCFDNCISHNLSSLSSQANIVNASEIVSGGIKDDLKLDFILCTVGDNGNKDGFDEDIKDEHSTSVNQRLDWEHSSEVIGVITNSDFVDKDDEEKQKTKGVKLTRSAVTIGAIVWKIWNRKKAGEILKRHTEGSLFCSMETAFDYAKCSECGESYAFDDEYCDHLNNRFNKNSNVYRILKGNKFVGAGVVERPADKNAVGLSVAKDKRLYNMIVQILNPDLLEYYNFTKKRLQWKNGH